MPDQVPGSIPFDVNDLTDIFKPVNDTPETSVPVEDTPFSQWYGQTVKDKLKGNSSEAIYKKKVDDYFNDMGATPGTKKGTIMNALKEMSASYEAGRHKEKYVPLSDRLHGEADTEYQKNESLYRQEAGTVAQNERADATNRRAVEVQKLKNQASAAKDRNTLQIAALKNNLSAIHEDALAGKTKAQTDFIKMKTGLEAQVAKEYPAGWEKMDPVTKKMIVDQKLQEKLGPDAYKLMLETEQLTNRMQMKPDDKASWAISQPPEVQDAFNKEHAQMEADKLKGKYPPGSGGSNGSFRILPTMIRNAAGDFEPSFAGWNAKDPGAAAFDIKLPQGTRRLDNKTKDEVKSYTMSALQNKAAFGSLMSSVADGSVDGIMGPKEGNPWSSKLREWGIPDGNFRTPLEGLMNFGRSNATFLHAKAVSGGSRFSDQRYDEMTKLMSSPSSDPHSAGYILGANHYMIELARATATGDISAKDVTPELMNALARQIRNTVDGTFSSRRAGNLPDFFDVFQQVQQAAKATKAAPAAAAANGTMDRPLTGQAALDALGVKRKK